MNNRCVRRCEKVPFNDSWCYKLRWKGIKNKSQWVCATRSRFATKNDCISRFALLTMKTIRRAMEFIDERGRSSRLWVSDHRQLKPGSVLFGTMMILQVFFSYHIDSMVQKVNESWANVITKYLLIIRSSSCFSFSALQTSITAA